jgi:hypothetical protein
MAEKKSKKANPNPEDSATPTPKKVHGRNRMFDGNPGAKLADGIAGLVKNGANLKTAAIACGAHVPGVYKAMFRVRQNRDPSDGDLAFMQKYEAARHQFLSDTLAAIKNNTRSRGDSKTGLLLLERVFPTMRDPGLKKKIRELERRYADLLQRLIPDEERPPHDGKDNLL